VPSICDGKQSWIVSHISSIHYQLVPLILGLNFDHFKKRVGRAGRNHSICDGASKSRFECGRSSVRLRRRIFENHWSFKPIIGGNDADVCFES
jgi:hypothetical protein